MYGYNVIANQKCQFLVYEYLSNGSLATFLKDENGRTRLPSHVRISIMFQLVRSVHFLHTGGCDNLVVYHRDIKSGNICLTQDYTAKLIDCGLAKFVPDTTRDAAQRSITPTMLKSSRSVVFGTPGYICPVYARGHIQYTVACDIFSIGVVLAELIVGSLQNGQLSAYSLSDFFSRYIKDEDDEPIENGWEILMQDADLLAQWNDAILERLCKLAVQCMTASPKRRISTLSLIHCLSEISLCDFTTESADMGNASVANEWACIMSDEIEWNRTDDFAIELKQNCVLCNRARSEERRVGKEC